LDILINKEGLAAITVELANKILANHSDISDVVFVGIQQGGALLGADIISLLQQFKPSQKIQYGQLDITFYRDDIRKEILAPDVMNLPFSIENKTVILIDDVLFTGRTIKAALDALLDYGRPAKVELCVLIDRKEHRQFPIQAEYVGEIIETKKTDKVKLVNKEVMLISV
jgi:pyrimidine operon attenuation protein / uracil phosphoribosyltransferase